MSGSPQCSTGSDYADLVRELHQAAEEHDRGHGPLHAAAANAIDHLMTLIRLMQPGTVAQRPAKCDCGFSAEVCKTNPCMRKKMATSGLNPEAKYPYCGTESVAQASQEPATTVMTAQGALDIAANIAEAVDSGRGNEKHIAKAIRDVAKNGYWEIKQPLVGVRDAAYTSTEAREKEITRLATIIESADIAKAMREKHGSPVGDAYSNGVWDQGIRIEQKIRELASPSVTSTHQSANRNWIEDAPHENGNYECSCVECGHSFIGHKRRVLCKLCSDLLTPSVTSTDREDAAK